MRKSPTLVAAGRLRYSRIVCAHRILYQAILFAMMLTLGAIALQPVFAADDGLQSLQNKAATLYTAGKNAEAAKLHAEIATRLLKSKGPDSKELERNYYSWALNTQKQGKHDLAIDLYNRGLNIGRKNHRLDSHWLDMQADSYLAKSNYDGAARCYKECIKITQPAANAKPTETESSFQIYLLKKLAYVYDCSKNYQEQLTVWQQALKLADRDLGSRKQFVDAAQQHPLGADFVLEASLGSDVNDLVESLTGLGHAYSQLGEYSKALPFFKRADSIMDEWYPVDFKLITFYNEYAELLRKLNLTKEADAIVLKSNQVAEKQKKRKS